MNYIDRIIALREDNDLKQKNLAQVLNKSQQGYSNLETGKVKFTVEEIIKLCEFYNVSADYILSKRNESETVFYGRISPHALLKYSLIRN